jgi:hypothetical protein
MATASKDQRGVSPLRISSLRAGRRRLAIAAGAVAGALAVAGCSGGSSDGGSKERFPFIAFAKDFAGFRSWPSRTTESAVSLGGSHIAGTRIVYINQLPPAGATAFPVGTLIVKNMQTDGRIFARAKRGGGYNATGAVDWEWFELAENAAGDVAIKWHGFGPPSGEMYAGDPQGGCNACHVLGKANDYVLSGWLALDGGGLVGAGGFPGAGGDSGAGGEGAGGMGDGTTSLNGAGGAKGLPDVQ